MGTPVGPKYILHSYMEPLGDCLIDAGTRQLSRGKAKCSVRVSGLGFRVGESGGHE